MHWPLLMCKLAVYGDANAPSTSSAKKMLSFKSVTYLMDLRTKLSPPPSAKYVKAVLPSSKTFLQTAV